MANVEKISGELEDTRKSEEELKQKIDNLRRRLTKRRELRNRIVNASNIVEANANSLPKFVKDKPKREHQEMSEPPEELKSDDFKEPESPTACKKGSWLSFFRTGRKEESREQEQEQFMACRDADELISSLRTNSEENNRSTKDQQREHQERVKAGRQRRFETRSSWGSFVPASRMMRC